MKILVTGAGALGGYFGSVLARAGEDVTFLERNQHLEAINRDGLRVESVAHGEFTVHAPAIERPDGTWSADLVLFCVKSYHNEKAIEAISPAVGDGTTILTLQNGIGSGDQLAGAFGRGKVLLGVAYYEGQRKAPGVVAELGGERRIVFGEEDGAQSPRAAAIRDALLGAGLDVELTDDVLRAVWNKLVMICALAGMTCITRSSFAEVIDTPATLDLTWRVVREAAAVGRAKGVNLADDVVESTMDYFQRFKNELVSSMYFDLEAGKPLELRVLNGAVSRSGEEAGVATPVNDFITACLMVADSRASNYYLNSA
jgi:2-dehydropantoate 2-reductase